MCTVGFQQWSISHCACTYTQVFVRRCKRLAPHLEDTQTSHHIAVGFDVSFQLFLVLHELLDNGFGQIAKPNEGIHYPKQCQKKVLFCLSHTSSLTAFILNPSTAKTPVQVAHTESPACLQSPTNLVDLIFPFHDLFNVFFG